MKIEKERGREEWKSGENLIHIRRYYEIWIFRIPSRMHRVGKIPGIIFSGSKYPGYLPRYLFEVDTFVQGIGYYPHARVFTAVNTGKYEVFTFKIFFPTLRMHHLPLSFSSSIWVEEEQSSWNLIRLIDVSILLNNPFVLPLVFLWWKFTMMMSSSFAN